MPSYGHVCVVVEVYCFRWELPPALRSVRTGEMVLLLHWSLLNYAAVVKILKKHGKHLPEQQQLSSEGMPAHAIISS